MESNDEVQEETVVGYTSHVAQLRWGGFYGILLFTTDRVVGVHGSGATGFAALGVIGGIGWTLQARSQAESMARSAQINDLIVKNEKNFAVPYSEITELRVKLPGGLTRGKVRIKTAQGEQGFKISHRGIGVVKDDWEFLKSPPPKLSGKIVVE